MINLAIELAEKQLREGTASAQVISHYLKLGSTRNILEQKHLEKKNELMDAQIASIKSYEKIEGLFKEAIAAYGMYSGENQNDAEDLQ